MSAPQGDGFDRIHGTGMPPQKPLGPPKHEDTESLPRDDDVWVPLKGRPLERNQRTGHVRTRLPEPR